MTTGLTEQQAQEALERYGPNRLPEAKSPSLAMMFLLQFKSPLIYMLMGAAGFSLWLGEMEDAIFIAVVLLLNASIGTALESSASRAAGALAQLVPLHVQVIRDGRKRQIEAEQLVPGDVVALGSGEKVPADIILTQAENLSADESLLTGESVAVEKRVGKGKGGQLFAGSMIIRGRAQGEVGATGTKTELGKIAMSVTGERLSKPPLMIRLETFTLNITLAMVGVVALMFVIAWLQGNELREIFMLAVALAVSAIPEGLPAAITIVLAIGMRRMAARNVIVRKLLAVEALGSCTFIASDKTGTLTVNELTVRRIVLPDGTHHDITAEGTLNPAGGEAVQTLARAGLMANEAVEKGDGFAGDAVDVALRVLARQCGVEERDWPECGRVPYESERGYAASLREVAGSCRVYVKGSVEKLLPMCDLTEHARALVLEEMETLAAGGYRVLAFASGIGSPNQEEFSGLSLLGLVGMIDPLRSEAREAVMRAREAGIEVAMITGDHPSTALAIARDLGLAETIEQVVSGTEINRAIKQGGEALATLVRGKCVFARVEPAHKQAIIEALQQGGHYVAVTGDGVNDAPALRASHVGVAMGKGGTDVARESADLILTDDDFSSIVRGIHEGRIIYANIRKVIFLLISTGLAEIVLFILATLAGLPMPLTAVQLLWLNLMTQSIQHVALAFEPAEGDELKKPPRHPEEAIFNRRMMSRLLVTGIYMGVLAFAVFALLRQWGYALEEARNLTLLLVVMFENVQLLNARSETRSLCAVPFFGNPWVLLSMVAAQGVHLGAAFIPPLAQTLDISLPTIREWGALMAVAMTVLLVEWLRHMISLYREKMNGSER